MVQNYGASGMPGMGPLVESQSREFLKNTSHVVEKGIKIDADTEDTANTPVTTLRPGLVLVRVEAGPNTGKFVNALHADCPADADIVEAVILTGFHNMLNREGVVEDQVGNGVEHGIVTLTQILWDTADAGTIAALKDVMNLIKFV